MKLLTNSKGFGIVNVLMAAGLVSMTALSVASVLSKQSKDQSEFMLKTQVTEIRRSLLSAIASDSAWQETLTRNAVMRCLSPHQKYCGPNQTETADIILYDASGQVFYDGTKPTGGFRIDGLPCDTYSTSGNDNCPVKAFLKWRAACTSGDCTQIENFVSLSFVYSPSSKEKKFPFNARNYGVEEVSRIKISASESPVLECARKSSFFIGEGQSFNGYVADTTGCVPYVAFQGAKGATGVAGMAGPQGVPGSKGADAHCSTP